MMTEKPPPLPTQISVPSQISTPAVVLPVSNHDVPQKVETVEEEPYTIKCICNFSDDDGNTIYCDTCDTWQHIDCFYPDNRDEALRENFAHSCAECKPRPLDRQRAIERTRRLRDVVVEEEVHDKKAKRPPSKSHKKKPKPNDLQLNGGHPGHDGPKHPNNNDHPPPAKKIKTSHRPSHSTSSQPAKRSPSFNASKTQTNGHPPSPATTPPDLPVNFEIHNFSQGFFDLHDHDVPIVQNNSFVSLTISNTMSIWLREPDRMRHDTSKEFSDVFQKLPLDIESKKTRLAVEQKKYSPAPGTQLRWHFLVAPSAIEKDAPLVELNGQIGFQNDYCADPKNMWEELTSPLPFVFFHPMLPLYIDTRQEGSEARYVRRSCKPNAVLDTYLSGGSEYHFWLVSDRAILANEQITLPWDFRFPKKEQSRMLHLLGIGDDETTGQDEPEMDEAEYQNLSTWVHRILSEYGGCACDLGSDCAFSRFHRQYLAKRQSRPTQSKKKSRKPKPANTISPTSTGHATNSRAASEGRLDEGADHDDQSISGSRSKAPSRDRTPLRQGSLDQPGILTEQTDRDKRKVAMVEDSFRRMEQQQQPPRKKKRLSDGTGSSASTKTKSRDGATSTVAPTNGVSNYVDSGTSRSKSGSPFPTSSPTLQSVAQSDAAGVATNHSVPSLLRSTYCDVAVQTDPVEGEWYSDPMMAIRSKRRIVSLSQKLLHSRHRTRLGDGDRRPMGSILTGRSSFSGADTEGSVAPSSATCSPNLDKEAGFSPSITSPALSAPGENAATGDAAPRDGVSTSPTTAVTAESPVTAETPNMSPAKLRTPDLRLQTHTVSAAFGLLGPQPLNTPSPATATNAQSLFPSNLSSPYTPSLANGFVHPSPVKKKLTLSDYTKSRLNKVAAGKPGPGMGNGPKMPLSDDVKPSTNGSGLDTPTLEKTQDTALTQTVMNTS